MAQSIANDLDYLAARIHARRSRIAEAARLDDLCRLQTIQELARAVYPDVEFTARVAFQRRLVEELARELYGFLGHLSGAEARLLNGLLFRFQTENLKVIVRGILTRTPANALIGHLVDLPGDLALDTDALAAAESIDAFAAQLPEEPLRKSLNDAIGRYRDEPRPFFLEAALDRGYFRELLAATDELSEDERELIAPLIFQEVDMFHLMLAIRGKFHYGLPPESLMPLHVEGAGIAPNRFSAMLAAPDAYATAGLAAGRVVDALPAAPPADSAAFEALAWNRFLRLANRAFRRSHSGFGTVVGYAGIRRVEVANLITLSEGLQTGAPPERIRARLIPRTDLESAHV